MSNGEAENDEIQILVKKRIDKFRAWVEGRARERLGNNERAKQIAELTLGLAYHAALPVLINPKFIHLVRINFFDDLPLAPIGSDRLDSLIRVEQLDHHAEADLLLSSIVQEMGQGYYQIEPEMRKFLLDQLVKTYGQERLRQTAALLGDFSTRFAPWAEQSRLERAQMITALNFLNPAKAREWFEHAEKQVDATGRGDREWLVAIGAQLQKLELGEQQTLDFSKSMVRIFSNDPRFEYVGSGFFVQNGLILTCAHVVSKARVYEGNIVFAIEGTEKLQSAQIVFQSNTDSLDVAILRPLDLPESTALALPLIASRRNDGHQFKSFGYRRETSRVGIQADGYIHTWVQDKFGRNVLEISSAEITHGFSGSPVWDSQLNGVVGMVSNIFKASSDFNFGLNKELDQLAFAIPSEVLNQAFNELQSSKSQWHLVHPYPNVPNFIGRIAERELLDDWLKDGTYAVLILRGLGGQGKSALAWRWLQEDVSAFAFPKVVWWSFYDNPSFENFVVDMLKYLGYSSSEESIVENFEEGWERSWLERITEIASHNFNSMKLEFLFQQLSETATLLVLDGFERTLRAYSKLEQSSVGDDRERDCISLEAESFLRALAQVEPKQFRSKILITTRLRPRAFERSNGELSTSCQEMDLDNLPFIDDYYVRVLGHVTMLNVRAQPTINSPIIVNVRALTSLKVLEPEATARIKVGVDGQWLRVSDADGRQGYVSAVYVENVPAERSRKSIADGLETVDLALGTRQMINLPENASDLTRLVADMWNRYGGLLDAISNALSIQPKAVLAVLAVEAGGSAFGSDGRMTIRFENHIFYQYWGKDHIADFDRYFRFNSSHNWTGHQWCPAVGQAWIDCHTSQSSEWDVFTFARSLDPTAAKMSISMGAPQLMGFNYTIIGYNSVGDMFSAFSNGEREQIVGFFDFVAGILPDNKALKALQEMDYASFAAYYNGRGETGDYYAGQIMLASEAFDLLKASMLETNEIGSEAPIEETPSEQFETVKSVDLSDLPELSLPSMIHLTSFEQILIKNTFRGYEKIIIEKEFGGGFSGRRIFLVLPVHVNGTPDARIVTYIGRSAELQDVKENYDRFVVSALPFTAPKLIGYYAQADQAILTYEFIEQAVNMVDYYHTESVERINAALDRLLDQTLGSVWYGQSHPLTCLFRQEYGRYLPTHENLEEIVYSIYSGHRFSVEEDHLQIPGVKGVYLNPLKIYNSILDKILQGRRSIVHGDLHPGNILVEKSDKAWLIDFGKVGERHSLFDFIKLEIYIRLMILGELTEAFSMDEYAQFEQALNATTLGQKVMFPTNPELAKAYQVIQNIRHIARKYMGQNPDFRNEYFPALFLYGFAMLKYFEINGQVPTRMIFVTTCVLANDIFEERFRDFQVGHALVVGVGEYQFMSMYNVPVAIRDADEVCSVLQDPRLCGYPSAQVHKLTGPVVTRAAILDAFHTLAGQLREEDTLLIFFAGHSAYGTDGIYYLSTSDTRLEGKRILPGTGVSENDLIDILSKIRAKRILLIINSCHSGEISTSFISADEFEDETPSHKLTDALLSTGSARIIITACRPEQKSWIGSGKWSIFSTSLINGLKGAAPNNHGYIDVFGLYEYLYHESKETAADLLGVSQEAELAIIKGVGTFPIALYRGASVVGDFDFSVPPPSDAAVRDISEERSRRNQAQLAGNGAIAQGMNVRAVGQNGILIEGNVSGNITTIGNNNTINQSKFDEQQKILLRTLESELSSLNDFYANLMTEYPSSVYEEFEKQFTDIRKRFKNMLAKHSDPNYEYLNHSEARVNMVQRIISNATSLAMHFQTIRKSKMFSRVETQDLMEDLILSMTNLYDHMNKSKK